MFRKIQRFLKFDSSDRLVFLEALGLLPLTAIGLRGLGFTRFYGDSNRWADAQAGKSLTENAIPDAQRTARLVQLAARKGLYHASCLEQSLALLWLLRREGIAGELRIGVRKEAGQLQAHAWVECLGFPLNESADVGQRYRRFDSSLALGDIRFQ
jgi:hypothetical protein